MVEPSVDFDGAWKSALETYFEAFIAFFLPEVHTDIDWTQEFIFGKEELRKLLHDSEVGVRRVDELVRVRRKGGGEAWVFVHIEVQSQRDADFPERMEVYYHRITNHTNEPVFSVAVLGDESPNWRPDTYERRLWGCVATFHYPVLKLNDWRARWAELAASDNPFALVVMAHLQAQDTQGRPEARTQGKLAFWRQLRRSGLDQQNVRELMNLLDWFMLLPKPVNTMLWAQFQVEEEGNQVKQVSGGILEIIQDQVEQSREEGMEIGMEKGMEKGVRLGILSAISLALETKFGADGVALASEVGDVQDTERIQQFYVKLIAGASLDELQYVLIS